MAGPVGKADLYRIRLHPVSITRLTHGARVSAVSANGAQIAVADARNDIDHVEQFANGRLQAIPGLGQPHAYTPEVSTAGVSYVELGQQGTKLTFTAKLFNAVRGTTSTLLTSKHPLEFPFAGENGRFGVAQGQGKSERIVLLGGGDRMTISAPRAASVVWASASLVAFSDFKTGTTIFDFISKAKGVIQDWFPLCWSPDHAALLLLTNGQSLGLSEGPKFESVKDIGHQPVGPIWSCGWVNN
jgi:hypothetical protein